MRCTMRRKDREITDIAAIDAFISREKIMRVGFCDDGEVYIVPVNYGYVHRGDECGFYFHGAMAGRKFELAKCSPKVGFEIDGGYRLIDGDKAYDHSAQFQSVIGTGQLSLVGDADEKEAALNCLMKHQTGRSDWSYDSGMLAHTAVFRIKVTQMTCKAK